MGAATTLNRSLCLGLPHDAENYLKVFEARGPQLYHSCSHNLASTAVNENIPTIIRLASESHIRLISTQLGIFDS